MREKLIELLKRDDCPLFMVYGDSVEVLADYLIANGVAAPVRCKDCKHCYEAQFSSTGYRCKVWGVYDTDCEVTPEHFCSYGERKTDG